MDSTFEALERLSALHKSGALTDEEFAAQKKRLLLADDSEPTAFCRACGKKISASAMTCSVCGAHQNRSVENKPKGRSTGKLVLWFVAWAAVLWVAGIVVVSGIAGAINPIDPGGAGAAAGGIASFPLLVIAIIASLVLTLKGWLPGTKKP